ncbi:MAG: hypothetical protein ACXVGF_04850 [Blastococcus sp.]
MAQHTNPLTGARYPDNASTTDLGTYYGWAVNDLSPYTIPRFSTTAARDTAYQNWVNAGNSMVDGMECFASGTMWLYRSGAWGRLGDVGKPRMRIYGTISVPTTTLFGIGPAASMHFTTAYQGDTYISAIQDGLQVGSGIYAVTYNINITGGNYTTGRSLLDIVGNTNNDVLSRSVVDSGSGTNGTDSTTLFLPASQQVRFLMFLTTNVGTVSVNWNIDMYRVGDW